MWQWRGSILLHKWQPQKLDKPENDTGAWGNSGLSAKIMIETYAYLPIVHIVCDGLQCTYVVYVKLVEQELCNYRTTDIFGHSKQSKRYRMTDCTRYLVYQKWHPLIPVCAKSDRMAVWETSIFGDVRIYFQTALFVPSPKLLLERF